MAPKVRMFDPAIPLVTMMMMMIIVIVTMIMIMTNPAAAVNAQDDRSMNEVIRSRKREDIGKAVLASLRMYSSEECNGRGAPYVMSDFGFGDSVAASGNFQLFRPGACSVFSLDPQRYIRINRRCNKFELYDTPGCVGSPTKKLRHKLCDSDRDTEGLEPDPLLGEEEDTGNDGSEDRTNEEGLFDRNDLDDEDVVTYFDMQCAVYSPGEVAEFVLGCNRDAGVASALVTTNTCVYDDEEDASVMLNCETGFRESLLDNPTSPSKQELNVTLTYHDGSNQCNATDKADVEKIQLDPRKCSDVEDLVPESQTPPNSDDGVSIRCWGGGRALTRPSYGGAEIVATMLAVAGMGAAITSSFTGSPAGGGVGSGFGSLELLSVAQFTALAGQMNLPNAPDAYLNFVNSLGWTILSVPVLGDGESGDGSGDGDGDGDGDGNGGDGRRLLSHLRRSNERALQSGNDTSGDDVTIMSAVEEHLARHGITRDDYFGTVLLILVLLHAVAAVLIGSYAYFVQKKTGKQLGSQILSISMSIALACVYPLVAAILFQFWIQMDSSGSSTEAANATMTALAVIAFLLLIGWIVVSARGIYRLKKDEHDLVVLSNDALSTGSFRGGSGTALISASALSTGNDNGKGGASNNENGDDANKTDIQGAVLVYKPITRRWRYDARLFYLLNIGMYFLQAAAIIFVQDPPFLVQPGLIFVASLCFAFLVTFVRPYANRVLNRSAIGLQWMFVLTAIPNCIFAVEPALFNESNMNTLGTISIILDIITLAMATCFILLQVVPRFAAYIQARLGWNSNPVSNSLSHSKLDSNGSNAAVQDADTEEIR